MIPLQKGMRIAIECSFRFKVKLCLWDYAFREADALRSKSKKLIPKITNNSLVILDAKPREGRTVIKFTGTRIKAVFYRLMVVTTVSKIILFLKVPYHKPVVETQVKSLVSLMKP